MNQIILNYEGNYFYKSISILFVSKQWNQKDY